MSPLRLNCHNRSYITTADALLSIFLDEFCLSYCVNQWAERMRSVDFPSVTISPVARVCRSCVELPKREWVVFSRTCLYRNYLTFCGSPEFAVGHLLRSPPQLTPQSIPRCFQNENCNTGRSDSLKYQPD